MTNNPNPDRYDGKPPEYESKEILVASLGSITGPISQMVVAQVPGETIYYFINDHLGTPQQVVDEAGNVVWQADYQPFGDANVVSSTSDYNFRFAGQYYDQETGLHYNYHRYYDPTLGRYLRADPIGIDGGINLYIYSQNNPANATDRLGLYTGISPVWGTPGLGPNPAAGNSKIDLGVDFKSFPCPKGQHLERDRAGFSNCMVQNPYAVAACAACAYTAFSGVGTPTAVGLCLACLSFEMNCASKHSKCVCDE